MNALARFRGIVARQRRLLAPKLGRPVLRSAAGAGTIAFSESSSPDRLGADERNGDASLVTA